MPGVLFPFVLSPSTSSVVWIWRLKKQTNKTQISFKLLFIVNTINIQNSNYSTCNKGQTRVHYHFFLHVINNGVQFFFHFKFYRMYKCPSWMLWFYFFSSPLIQWSNTVTGYWHHRPRGTKPAEPMEKKHQLWYVFVFFNPPPRKNTPMILVSEPTCFTCGRLQQRKVCETWQREHITNPDWKMWFYLDIW